MTIEELYKNTIQAWEETHPVEENETWIWPRPHQIRDLACVVDQWQDEADPSAFQAKMDMFEILGRDRDLEPGTYEPVAVSPCFIGFKYSPFRKQEEETEQPHPFAALFGGGGLPILAGAGTRPSDPKPETRPTKGQFMVPVSEGGTLYTDFALCPEHSQKQAQDLILRTQFPDRDDVRYVPVPGPVRCKCVYCEAEHAPV